jgi:hypothetical protein
MQTTQPSYPLMMKEDKEEGIPGEQGACCLSQQLYIDSGNNKNLLYLLSINNEPLFSFEKEPGSLLPKTSFMRPRNTDFVSEIVRRVELLQIVPVPSPSNWTRVQTMECLDRNPVQDEVDIAFLTTEAQRLRAVLEKTTQEHQKQAMNAVDGNRSSGIVRVS